MTIAVEQILPYFQPIIGASELEIIGYEVLGREKTTEGTRSLGEFFYDKSKSVELKMNIDNYIRNQALDLFCKTNSNQLLFLNINPTWLSLGQEEDLHNGIKTFIENGMDPSRIVLEITEVSFNDKTDCLEKLLLKYRNLGCKIAIDDVGKGFSNLDRIVSIKPDILKVDLNFITHSTYSRSHRDVIYSLSILSHKSGAALLFEGIETQEQMYLAWRNGGQYYQGYLFSYPKKNMKPIKASNMLLKQQLKGMIHHEKSIFEDIFLTEKKLNTIFKGISKKITQRQHLDEYIQEIIKFLPNNCYRIYLCDENGFQKSSNFYKDRLNDWIIQTEYLNRNWSWRPYYLQNVTKMNIIQKGVLSDSYHDLESNEVIWTFSYPLEDSMYLYVDIRKEKKTQKSPFHLDLPVTHLYPFK